MGRKTSRKEIRIKMPMIVSTSQKSVPSSERRGKSEEEQEQNNGDVAANTQP
jgi:hypothetical protein